MRKYQQPESFHWKQIFQRPTDQEDQKEGIAQILLDVKKNGDAALIKYTERFDGVLIKDFKIPEKQINQAVHQIDSELKNAIQQAIENIQKYHVAQYPESIKLETTPGIRTSQIFRPIDRVGLYIPGGTAPLLSTLMMLAIPAQIAKCPEIVITTPPDENGQVDPAILYIANVLGLNQIYTVGGAQAIAAMAYGTESVPRVYKIFGPGNSFVTQAKEMVQLDGVAIDLPAGPSEVLVYADETANPAFVAADLLSQAEHGGDSQVVLVTTDQSMIDRVEKEIMVQLETLPRKEVALEALKHSCLIYEPNEDQAFEMINTYAPEHFIVACDSPELKLPLIRNAGSVFLGHLSAEAIGDYAAGPNHTLPTNHHARAYSGVSLSTFMKKISVQLVSEEGFLNICDTVEKLAESEQLIGHQRAISIRKTYLDENQS